MSNKANTLKNFVKKFGMKDSKHASTPLSTSIKLNKDKQGDKVDQKLYRSMIDSLLYLTASRLDIMYSVYACARFQSSRRVSHLIAVKCIIRYVNGTIELELFYPKHTSFDLFGYCDVDFAGCKVARKSTSGTCYFLGNSLVLGHSRSKIVLLYPRRSGIHYRGYLLCSNPMDELKSCGF